MATTALGSPADIPGPGRANSDQTNLSTPPPTRPARPTPANAEYLPVVQGLGVVGAQARQVVTVRGPVAAADLGVTLSHEHLFCDGTAFYAPPATSAERDAAAATVSQATRDLIAQHSCANRDNIVLDDLATAIAEAERFAQAGGRTIVDVTSQGIGPRPAAVQQVSLQTGVNIVHGCGPYCEYTLPAELASRETNQILEDILECLTVGIDGTTIRAGVIGEIGVDGRRFGSDRREAVVTKIEERGLRAAARASLCTGTSVVVHQPNVTCAPQRIMEILESEELPPSRVCLGHMSSILDIDVHIEALRRGYWIAYDNFGMNLSNRFVEQANDERRLSWLGSLLRRGFGRQILVSHDTWCKIQLSRYGGNGFTHIHDVIIPRLSAGGLSGDLVGTLLVENPARFLTAGQAG